MDKRGLTWTLTHRPCSPRSAQKSPPGRLRPGVWVASPRLVVVVVVVEAVVEIECNLAACSLRPSRMSKLRFLTCLRSMGPTKCLVIKSAVLVSPGILTIGTIFFAHCSWSQRQFTSM